MANMVNNKLYFQDTKPLKDCIDKHFNLEDNEYVLINDEFNIETDSLDINFDEKTIYFESRWRPPFDFLNELGQDYDYSFIAMGSIDITEDYWEYYFCDNIREYDDVIESEIEKDIFYIAKEFNRIEDLYGYAYDDNFEELIYTGNNEWLEEHGYIDDVPKNDINESPSMVM